jgi:hypothetical protein
MPLIRAGVEAHDWEMTTDQVLRSASHPNRPWARWLTRLSAPFLDAQLATGYPEGTSRALTFRAQQIASPAGRRELARQWEHVLDQARRPPVPRTPRAPLCRDRIAAAERDVRAMVGVLTGPRPITVRGAAMASSLLSDGSGPVHNCHSPLDLAAAVRDATRQMTEPPASTPPARESVRGHTVSR